MTTPAPSSRQRWLVPVVVVVLSVTVGAGLLARELYRRPDQSADDTSAAVSPPSTSGSGEPAAADAVRMTDDARAHPQADAVRRVIETYFSAINTKQYQQWTSVVSAQRVAEQSLTAWKNGIRTTKDRDAVVYRIERGSGSSLRVLVGFTSVQNPEDAPQFFQEPCIKWRLVLPMVVEQAALKIDSIDKGPPPEHEKC
ncbi:hypothetical protein MUY14_25925 [Amycolatopsis sp. FBCC-B4732]|uniref:hypothetical protein n=1 Tax=Amycolatopsis sp. FBCC-B4732 TaxID=3079339 RepID=UPI001FF2037B|nr:hypothetical protein [Amycolatopsis sp. FBCC-B4732]UOX85231.1 hypothetical protein MUY14_25925 [Amycolatopsis sp. FBCC-B4732]